MARTAVIAGTATAVSGGIQRSATNKAAQQQQAAAAQQQAMVDQAAAQVAAQQPQQPTAAPTGPDRIARLKDLGELKAAGVLTEAEFDAEKARILAA